ncbi:MAG: hypothetical protein J6K49_01545 [Clostridia bacterium]|nr:hypothetical protein [Clostridia bacterium]
MKKSKKALALVLAVIMSVMCCSAAAQAATANEYIPSIVIPGIFQSETKYYDGAKVQTNSPFFMDDTLDIVGMALTDALIPIGNLLINQEDKDEQAAYAVANLLGEVLLEKNRCDENGKFVHDIRATKYNDSFRDLSAYDQEYILDQIPLQNYIDIAGEENLYFFSYASFGNMIDTAQELYDFIQFVKADSGSDKVNIVPISQGGSVANALLQIYADNGRSVAEDIHRILFIVPALDGSILMGEIYQYGLLDDSYELYNTMFPALMGEDDMMSYLVNIILRILPNADINNILDIAVKVLIEDYLRYSTLFWGLCPSGNYPACREMYLLDEGLENILAQADWYYGAQCNSDANILQAKADGVEIFDVVDYNYPLYQLVDSYDDVNADGIIQLDSTSMGAFSLGVDKKLPADYVPTHSNCEDPQNHDHTDPNGIVDVCTGLLPETTFYFYNQDHEKTGSNDVIMKLAAAILTDNSFTSVHSYPDRFPQFNVGRNSKGLMRDVEEMKAYDTSKLSPELKAELEDAIAQAEEALNNTVVDINEFEAAKANFYSVCDKVEKYENGEINEAPKENGAYMDFSNALAQIVEVLSKLFYILFGGAGFGDM